jgi:uncharacterized protein YecT (DUF1311 family)
MRRVRGLAFLALLTLAALTGRAVAAAPNELQGSWEVTQVAVDTLDQPHWGYEPDDPRVLGRILVLGADGSIDFNLGREACARVEWRSEGQTMLSTLVAKTYSRPARKDLKRSPSLEDFGLHLADRSVAPWRAVCPAAGSAKAPAILWANAWFVRLDGQQLAVGYQSNLLLILTRAQIAPPYRPSFACTGALNVTEAAICNSLSLAGLDRSVHAAYQRSLKRRAEEKSAVIEEQRQWIKARNQCGADSGCIEDRMSERIELLMQD